MKRTSWKINRKLSNTEKEVLLILATCANKYIDNQGEVYTKQYCYFSMQSDGGFGFYGQLRINYDKEISYEEAIKYLKELVKERQI